MTAVRLMPVLLSAAALLPACQNFPEQQKDPVWPYPDPPSTPMPDDQQAPPSSTQQTPPQRGPQTTPLPVPDRRLPPATPVPDDGASPAPGAPTSAQGPRTLGEASGPAALQLAQQAREQHAAGDLNGAASSIERALRVEPQNAFLWLTLAELRREQGAPNDAKAMAQRAMARAPNNPWVAAPAWRVIQQAELAAGNQAAASEAGRRAAQQQRLADEAER
ncbi:tetratricopeptide repeat protein [bacterium]|nr:tetratricopeptide repeat protein [bacterium]